MLILLIAIIGFTFFKRTKSLRSDIIFIVTFVSCVALWFIAEFGLISSHKEVYDYNFEVDREIWVIDSEGNDLGIFAESSLDYSYNSKLDKTKVEVTTSSHSNLVAFLFFTLDYNHYEIIFNNIDDFRSRVEN